MRNRGLLTEGDREFFRGERDVDDPDQSARTRRSRIRKRIDNVVEDLELLQEVGEEDLVREFYAKTGRYERLETELQSLMDALEDQKADPDRGVGGEPE